MYELAPEYLFRLMIPSQCPVIIGNNVPISITDHEPDPDFETMRRVLDVSI